MYFSYWLHESGMLYRSASPDLNPTEPGWEQLGEGEFKRLQQVAKFAMYGWYNVDQLIEFASKECPEFPVYYDAQGREHAEY